MSKKIITLFLLLTISVISLAASGADIVYHQTPVNEMVLEAIPGVSGKSGILLGYFSVIASNNSTFEINFSRPDVYRDIIFTGKVDGRNDETLTFDLFYTWDGDTQFRSGTYDGSNGIDIKVAKQNNNTCYLKLYLKVDKDISKLNGIYKLESGTLPAITVERISIKDRNFTLTVNGKVQTASQKTAVTITGSTPYVNTGTGLVPGVSTEPGAMTESVTPRLTAVFLEPGTDIEINDGTRNLNYDTILSSPGNVAVTDIKITVSNSDFSERVMSFSQEFDVTLSSDGILSDSAGRAGIPYTMKTSKGTASGLTIDKNLDTYHLSELTTGGFGIIKVVFDFQDVSRLLNAVAGTYSDTVTVTVTATQ